MWRILKIKVKQLQCLPHIDSFVAIQHRISTSCHILRFFFFFNATSKLSVFVRLHFLSLLSLRHSRVSHTQPLPSMHTAHVSMKTRSWKVDICADGGQSHEFTKVWHHRDLPSTYLPYLCNVGTRKKTKS